MDSGPHNRPDGSGNERRRGYYQPAVWLLGLTAAAAVAGFVESKAGLPAADTYSLVHILGVSAVAAGLGGALLDFTDNLPVSCPVILARYKALVLAVSAVLCLNSANVVVPMHPCAAHSANDMDGHQYH